MPDATPTARRHPFQFRLWQLLWWTTVVALVLGIHHLMGRAIERFGMGVVGISVFIFAETTVVISGTAIAASRGHQRLRTRLLRGVTAGSCLAALCFGFIPVLLAIGTGDPRPLVALAVVAALGGLIGLLIGLIVPLFCPLFAAHPVAQAPQRFSMMFTDRTQHPALPFATDRAMRVLVEAKRHAVEHRQALITPEHLLLAVTSVDRGVGRFLLERTVVNVTALISALAAWIVAIPCDDAGQPVRLSRESEQVFDCAMTEARRLLADTVPREYFYIGTEHLLLGLLRYGDCLAARCLQRERVTLERLRTELTSLMNGK